MGLIVTKDQAASEAPAPPAPALIAPQISFLGRLLIIDDNVFIDVAHIVLFRMETVKPNLMTRYFKLRLWLDNQQVFEIEMPIEQECRDLMRKLVRIKSVDGALIHNKPVAPKSPVSDAAGNE